MGLLSWWHNADEEQARSDAADARLQALNAEDRQRYGEDWYRETQRNLNRDTSAYGHDVGREIDDAFDDGWNDGLDNLTSTARKPFGFVGDVAGALLKALPWWLWLAALAYGAWRLGLLKKWLK